MARGKSNSKKHIWQRFSKLKNWQIFLILVLFMFISATFLRLNNVGMVQRRDAVIAADKQGDDEVTKERLYDLQRFTAAHMNASTGVVYLQSSFDRDWEKIQKKAEKENSQNGENIYKKIEDEVCGPEARANGWRWPDPRYISCQRRELAKYPSGQELISSVNPPNKELYRQSFVSPLWSPDYAGFSVLITLLLALVFVSRFLATIFLSLVVRRRYQGR